MKGTKKRHMGKRMFLAAAMLLILVGCGKEKVESEGAVTGNHRYSVGEDGIVYNTWLERGGDKFLFYDMESESVYPLCNRPNCRHIPDAECAAIKDMSFAPLIYRDKLYYYTCRDSFYHLYSSDVSGENERDLFALGENYHGFGKSVVTGRRFYTDCAWYEVGEEEVGILRGGTELLKIDLDTGKAETLLRSEMGPDGQVWWDLEHVYGDKIYFTARYRGEVEGDTLKDGIYSLDLSTGEVQNLIELDDIRTADWRDGEAVYYQQIKKVGDGVTLYKLELESGDSEELITCRVPETGALLDGRFVWWELDSAAGNSIGRWRSCDLETKEVEEFGKATPYQEVTFILETFVKDGKEMLWCERLMRSESGEETRCYVVLSAEDLLKGDENGQVLQED